MRNKIKLVVSDLDGTLLDNNHNLPINFWEIEQQLVDNNILFAIASGRQFFNIISLFDKIKERTLFLAENGTFAYYKGEELFVNDMPKANAVEFIKIGRTISDAYVILCGKNSAYVENTTERFLSEVRKYYGQLQIVDDLTKVEDVVLKVTLCDFNDVPTNSYRYFASYKNEFKVAISGLIWLDITNFSANKGIAIKRIQDFFSISKDETMVFGDYLNDYEMMQVATYSYAMKNAHDDIIKVSNYVTDFDNNTNGVTQTIKKYLLQMNSFSEVDDSLI